MTARPGKILLVTERPLMVLHFRALLEAAGLGFEHGVSSLAEAGRNLQPGDRGLMVIDSENELQWETLRELRRDLGDARFVIWASGVTPRMVQAALEAGMDGLLSTSLPPREAGASLLRICQGERQFRFEGALQPQAPAEPGLTPREQQVLALVMQGRKNREIAADLATTEGSVKVYLNRIFGKTGAKSRHELALVGHGVLRHRTIRPRLETGRPTAAHAFDAAWMFTTTAADSRFSGERSYDSPQR